VAPRHEDLNFDGNARVPPQIWDGSRDIDEEDPIRARGQASRAELHVSWWRQRGLPRERRQAGHGHDMDIIKHAGEKRLA
jgi:hypothetical protein